MNLFLKRLPLNIQLFAEGDGSDVGGTEGSAGTEGSQGAGGTTGSLDDVLKAFKPEDVLNHPSFKSVLDSRIGSATSTALANARARWEAEQNENLSEAEKLAKMTKEERERYQFKKDQEKFAAERSKFEHEKLIVEAAKELTGKGIDATLASFVVGKDADETKKNLEAFEKSYNAAVEAAVNDKLKGGVPPKKAPANTTTYTDDQLRNMTPEQINANWDAVVASMCRSYFRSTPLFRNRDNVSASSLSCGVLQQAFPYLQTNNSVLFSGSCVSSFYPSIAE